MGMIVIFTIVAFAIIAHDIYTYNEEVKAIEAAKAPEKRREADLWEHRFIKMNKIKPLLEEVEVEEVVAEDVPAVWRVEYNERKDKFVTIEIKS